MQIAHADVHPVFQSLVTQPEAAWVNEASFPDFLRSKSILVLLIAGNTIRFPEGLDVAVVLPQLRQHLAKQEAPWFIALAEEGAEEAIARRYGITQRPALVFFCGGQYQDCINGMQDWSVYLKRVDVLLGASPKRVPIPLQTQQNQSTCGS